MAGVRHRCAHRENERLTLGEYFSDNPLTYFALQLSPWNESLSLFFLAGWLLPLWVSASVLFQFLESEVLPRLAGEQPANSFPFVEFSALAFTGACIWLGAVILFWVWRAIRS